MAEEADRTTIAAVEVGGEESRQERKLKRAVLGSFDQIKRKDHRAAFVRAFVRAEQGIFCEDQRE